MSTIGVDESSSSERIALIIRPPACTEVGCPQASKGRGFALPSGDPRTARICLLLETPAEKEVEYDLVQIERLGGSLPWDVPDIRAELDSRVQLYPDLDSVYLRRGAPVVGPSGVQLFAWALKSAGIQRRDCYVANVLQCYPGKAKDGAVAYPKGEDRKRAESCCAKLWWRIEEEFKPDVSMINIHPAAIIRSAVAFPVQWHVFVQAKKFVREGARVLVACGGKAAEAWFNYGGNVMKWAGHWQRETEITRRLRKERLS